MKRCFVRIINMTIIILLIITNRVSALGDINIDAYLEFTNSSILDEEEIDSEAYSFQNIDLDCKKQVAIKEPEMEGDFKIIGKDKRINIIDEKDGWALIDIEDRLYFISSEDFYIDKDGNPLSKSRIILHGGKKVYFLKGESPLAVLEEKKNYLKVKTPDGFFGWINNKCVKEDKGIFYLKYDTDVYYTMEFTPMNRVKDLKRGESIKKVDERNGYCLLESEGKMSWVKNESLSLYGSNALIKEDKSMYEAGVDYVYSKGEVINVINGSNKDFIKVRTPKGDFAWVKRECLGYDKNRNLVAERSCKAYYTGNNEGNTISEKGNLLADTAFREVGYKEGENNKTKYGDWYGLNAEWCGIFVSWCSYNSGISEGIIPKSSYCRESAEWFVNNKNFYSKQQYTPKKGDIAYFNVKGEINHIGIVYEVTNESIITIEGNMSDSVLKVTHVINDENIAGFASPIF